MQAAKIPLVATQRVSTLIRWHMVAFKKDENLAEHQYLVTMNAIRLHSKVKELYNSNVIAGNKFMDDKLPLSQVVDYAMMHDIPETELSDTSSVSKSHIKKVAGNSDIFDDLDQDYMNQFGVDLSIYTPEVKLLVDVCDKFQALIAYLLYGDSRLYKTGRNVNIDFRLEKAFTDKFKQMSDVFALDHDSLISEFQELILHCKP